MDHIGLKRAVDDALTRSVKYLSFAPILEAQYETETGQARCRHLMWCTAIGLAVFVAFAIPDKSLVPDVIGLSLILRLGVAAPILVVAIAMLRHNPRPFWREFAQAFMTIAGTGIILSLMLLSQAPLRGYEHYGIGLLLLYPTIVQRLHFRYLAGTIVLSFALYAVAVGIFGEGPAEAREAAVMIMLGTAVFTLIAGYSLERQERVSYLLSLRDRLRNTELDAVAKTDPLTHLANRRGLTEKMAALWAAPEMTARPVCVILLDIDWFKLFNDRYGHLAGDKCIVKVARTIAATLPGDSDLAVRFGGEELLLVLDDCDLERGLAVAERARAAIEAQEIPHDDGVGGRVTVSLGVASVIPSGLVTPEALIAGADAALYTAKSGGRNQVWPKAPQDAGSRSLVRSVA